MSRSFKRKWKWLVVSGILFIMVFAVLTALYEYRELIYCKEKQYAAEAQLQAYQKTLYVAEEKITKGTILTEDKVKQHQIHPLL